MHARAAAAFTAVACFLAGALAANALHGLPATEAAFHDVADSASTLSAWWDSSVDCRASSGDFLARLFLKNETKEKELRHSDLLLRVTNGHPDHLESVALRWTDEVTFDAAPVPDGWTGSIDVMDPHRASYEEDGARVWGGSYQDFPFLVTKKGTKKATLDVEMVAGAASGTVVLSCSYF